MIKRDYAQYTNEEIDYLIEIIRENIKREKERNKDETARIDEKTRRIKQAIWQFGSRGIGRF